MALSLILQTMTGGMAMVMTPTLAQTEVPPGPEGQAVAVASITTGILAYSRWPDNGGPITLCVAGQSAATARLSNRTLVGGRPLLISRRPSAPVPTEGCDAIFIAGLPPAESRRLLRSVIDRPVLTLDENSDGCAVGVMFCIRPAARGGMTFDLDIDAVSRSRIRVDPRVLALGRRTVTP